MTATTMNTYYIHDERGFSSEYTLAVAPDEATAEALKERGFRRITRKAWISELRRSRGGKDGAFSSHAGYLSMGQNWSNKIEDVITDCEKATLAYVADPMMGRNIA